MSFSGITSSMTQSAQAINNLITQIGTQLNNQFGPLVNQIKGGLDVVNAGKDVVSSVIHTVTGENVTIESIQQGAIDFNQKWDAFANEVNEIFSSTSSLNQVNILETFAQTHFGNDIYNLGSTIKNELPNILGGIAGYQNAVNAFTSSPQTVEEAANNIVNGVETIISATEQLSGSINNVVQSYTGNGIPLLNTLSNIGGTAAITNLTNVLHAGATGASLFTTGNQLVNAIQSGNLQGVTNAMAKGANTVNDLLSQLHSLVPGFPNAQIPTQITSAIQQLQNGQAVYNAAGSMITALVADASGKITVGSLANLATHFDQNWDTFSSKIDALFNVTPNSGQQAVLETLAKSMFGENVFYAGGAIKRQLPGVLSGIAGVQDALKQFGGSYRDPIAAAKKIKIGVEKMVGAIEKIGKSLNDMVKFYQGKGDISKGTGYKLLDTLANLGDTKGIKALDTALRVGGGAVGVLGNAGSVIKALNNQDFKGAISAIKKAIDDVKDLTKKGKYNNDNSQQDNSSQKQKQQSTNASGNSPKPAIQAPSAQTNSYVCSGATMRCTFGTSQARLTVLPSRTVYLTGQPQANISDHQSMVNLAPFGRCRSLAFPPTASATAAAHGHLTPMPCIHNTPAPWMGGKMDVLIKGQPALQKTSKCQCMWGGTISLVTNGQVGEGTTWINKIPKQSFVNEPYMLADEETESKQLSPSFAEMQKLLQATYSKASRELSSFLSDNSSWFKNSTFQGIQDEPNPKKRNGSTDALGTIWLKKEIQFRCTTAFMKAKHGEKLNRDEELAIATLWHEINHNMHDLSKDSEGEMSKTNVYYMETANEFVSRKTLPEFYNAMGGEMSYPEFMNNRDNTGYNEWVRRYDKAIADYGLDEEVVLKVVQKGLYETDYHKQKANLINGLIMGGQYMDEETHTCRNKISPMEAKKIVDELLN